MAGELTKNNSLVLAQKLAKIGLVIATASITIFVPLLFEISREGQMIETEKVQVKDFRNQGYSDRQLSEMGFCEASVLRSPRVL